MLKRTLIAVLTIVSIGTVARADVLIGIPDASDTQDCIAFGCGITSQFIFDSSYFSAPISISELQFFNSLPESDSFDPGTYTFRLATSTHDYASPDEIFANNVGADVQLFAQVVLAGSAVGPVFSFAGSPFVYNPANGDLLLEITKAGSNNTFSAFTDYNDDPAFKVSRIWTFDDTPSGTVDANYGPVVKVVGSDVTPVPEPMTLTLTGLGLAGLARQLKKRGTQNT